MRPSRHRLRNVAVGTILGLAVVAGTGCGDDGGPGDPDFQVVGENRALVRVAHLSPDAGTVDVRVTTSNGLTFTEAGVAFGGVSAYREIEADFDGTDVTLDITVAPGTPEAQTVSREFEVLRGDIRTLTAIGRLVPQAVEVVELRDGSVVERPTNADAFRVIAVRDVLDPDPGRASVSFVHAAPSVGPVRVTLPGIVSPGVSSSLVFGQSARSVAVPQESYTFNVRDDDDGRLLGVFESVRVDAGRTYTVWAIETPAGEIDALVTQDRFVENSTDPTPTQTLERLRSRARFVNLSRPSASAPLPADSDLYFAINDGYLAPDGTVVEDFRDATFGMDVVTPRFELPAADYRIATLSTDVPPDTLRNVFNATLDPGETTTVVAWSARTDQPRATALPFDESIVADPGEIRLRIAQLTRGTTRLTAAFYPLGIFEANPDTLPPSEFEFPELSQGGFTGFFRFPAGEFTMRLEQRRVDGEDIIVTPELTQDVTLTDGAVRQMIVFGDANISDSADPPRIDRLQILFVDETGGSR